MKSNSPYNVYKSHFINELYKRKGVVTNTDIDGILSASLLCKLFPHLSVLGFTNSCTNIYLTDNVKKNDVLYVDIFMCDKDVFSVDNHIIGSKHCPGGRGCKLHGTEGPPFRAVNLPWLQVPLVQSLWG